MIKKDQPVRHILALFGLSRRMSPNKYLHYVHKRNTIQEVDILIKILAYLNAVDTNLTPNQELKHLTILSTKDGLETKFEPPPHYFNNTTKLTINIQESDEKED